MSKALNTSVPSVADVARIAAMGNRVLRSLEITECYSQLSLAMRGRTGETANWCTFATWASRQAGSTIRGEDLLDRLKRRLGEQARMFAPIRSVYRILLRKGLFEPGTRLGRAVAEIHTPFDAFERASESVAQGNLKVFAEIGREFARFLASVPTDARPDSAEMQRFCAELRPGPPPDGQDYLKEAFTHYQQQRHESDPATGAAWMLLANLKIGLHEQTRLQPQIAEAIDAPLVTAEDLGARVLHKLIPGSERWYEWFRKPAAAVIGWGAARIRNAAVTLTRETVTEAMMVLRLPNVVLSLGKNLEAPVPPIFSGTPHPALADFLRRYDTCPPGTSDCGARDWADLPQRMHYILHLFRAYSEEASLFSKPFTDEQVAQFRRGIVPNGVL